MFTTEKARAKMARAYPEPASVCEPRPESHNHCAAVLAAYKWSRYQGLNDAAAESPRHDE
jgi:hypothetical protein